MSGKKRASVHRGSIRSPEGSRAAENELGVSNQAVMAELGSGSGHGRSVVDADAVRAVAVPFVERGLFAVHAEPRAAEVVAKYVDVLKTSRLPSDRKALLIERLVGDQEAAVAAREAVRRHFGDEQDTGESAALDALGAVFEALQQDPPSDLQGRSASERAEAWIEQLAGEQAEAVQGLCRDVHFILGFEEDEEEELVDVELEG